jgi:hypothetical protein
MKYALYLSAFYLTAVIGAANAAYAEPVFVLRDYIQREWNNELVTYTSNLPENIAEAAVLVDENGKEFPVQLEYQGKGVYSITFLVDRIPPVGSKTLSLRRGQPKQISLVKKSDIDGRMILDGGIVAVVVPQIAHHDFDPPVPLNTLTAPLFKIRGKIGNWIGRGHMQGDCLVTQMQSELVADGTVYAQSQTNYKFADGGIYCMDVRVVRGQDAVFVYEFYDVPSSLKNRAYFNFYISKDLSPQRAAAEIRPWRKRSDTVTNSLGLDYELDFTEDRRELSILGYINGWPETAMRASFYRPEDPDNDFLTLMPARIGRWRNPTPLHVMTTTKGDVTLQLPIFFDNNFGGVHRDSRYHTGKLEPDWPLSATRREWVIHL